MKDGKTIRVDDKVEEGKNEKLKGTKDVGAGLGMVVLVVIVIWAVIVSLPFIIPAIVSIILFAAAGAVLWIVITMLGAVGGKVRRKGK